MMPKGRLLKINKSEANDDLVTKLRRRMESNKDIDTHERPLLYSERRHGVIPEGNPRTDKWDIMQEAMEEVANMHETSKSKYVKSANEKEAAEIKAAKIAAAESALAAVTQDGKSE